MNSEGQLGLGDTANRTSPVQVGTATNWSQVAAGINHTLAIRADGTLWAWGLNNVGQLGLGDTTQRNSPVQVGTATNWSQVAAGANNHILAIRTDGTLWAWGVNGQGQLGLGDTSQRNSPVQVGTATNWSQVATGGVHTLAIRTDGTLWAWGWNGSGQLGLGDTSQRNSPAQVGTATNWRQVAAGDSHTLAIRTDGTLWAWGGNGFSQLGLGDTTQRNSPAQVGTATNWRQVAASASHTLAIRTDGTLWAWGRNAEGQLGLGDTTQRNSPVQVGTATNWRQVAAGAHHTLVIRTDGTLWAWGANGNGQLGLGDTTQRNSPVQVGILPWSQVTAGRSHTLAIRTDGTLWAWAWNGNGQLGLGDTTQRNSPVQVGTAFNWRQVTAGGNHTLAIRTDGTLWAWGLNSNGQLGLGDTTQRNSPVQVGTATNWSQVTAGDAHTLAIRTDGTLWAWGNNAWGQLGLGGGTQRNSPVQVGTAFNWRQVTAGHEHTLAIRTDGTLWAWGNNSWGQLGLGDTASRNSPVQVGVATNWRQVAIGAGYTLAIRTDGTLWAWGANTNGQLGLGDTTNRHSPVQVGTATNWSQVDGGSDHTLAIRTDGTLWAWGLNSSGQLGLGDITQRNSPVQVPVGVHVWFIVLGGGGFHTSGTFISSTLDTGQSSDFTTLGFTISRPVGTDLNFQLRSATTLADLAVAPWRGPDGTGATRYATSGTAIHSVHDSHRFIQYRAFFSTADTTVTPSLSDITINYQFFPASAWLISSPFNTGDPANALARISWTQTLATGTNIRFQVRTAPNVAGVPGTWTPWAGPDNGVIGTFSTTTFFTDHTGGQLLDADMRDGLNDQWIQYQVWLDTTNTVATPVLHDVQMTYVINVPPEFNPNYPTTGAGGTRVLQRADNLVDISFSVGDVDSAAGTITPNFITPSFEFSLDGGTIWSAINPVHIVWGPVPTGGEIRDVNADGWLDLRMLGDPNGNEILDAAEFLRYTLTWNAKAQLTTFTTTTQIRIITNDNNAANNIARRASVNFTLDTRDPVVGTPPGGGTGININQNVLTVLGNDKTATTSVILHLAATDNSSFEMIISEDVTFTGAVWRPFVTTTPFTLSAGDGLKTVNIRFRDAFGNITAVLSDTITLDTISPAAPVNMFIQEVSNPAINEWRLFINWTRNTEPDFARYEIFRSTDGTTFTLLRTITDINLNYHMDTGLASSTVYHYRIRAIDDIGNLADSVVVSLITGGQPTDLAPPVISAVTSSEITVNSARITWTTNELATTEVNFSTDLTFGQIGGVAGFATSHSVVATGLVPGTLYNFMARSCDAARNCATSTAATFTTLVTDVTPPVISAISVSNIAMDVALIEWITNEPATSLVNFGTTTGLGMLAGEPTAVTTTHSVILTRLIAGTRYHFQVRSLDVAGNIANSELREFTTLRDTTPPIISNISTPVITSNTIVVYWETNELARGMVEWGTSPGVYPNSAPLGTVYTISHVVTLPNLIENTTYFYRIRAQDQAGNVAHSAEQLVTTSAVAQVTIVRVVERVVERVIGVAQEIHDAIVRERDTAIRERDEIRIERDKIKVELEEAKAELELRAPKDETLPTISNVQVSRVGPFESTISWRTDEPTTGFINYGETRDFGFTVGSDEFKTEHSITLRRLRMGTRYFFQIVAVDMAGNRAVISSR